MKRSTLSAMLMALTAVGAFAAENPMTHDHRSGTDSTNAPTEFATFGLGCFWCGEAVFQRLDGVKAAVSGYEGGHVAAPTYKQVCEGDTGHAEVIRVEFDPAVIAYEQLLDVFWQAHDPTQLNRQGNDVGTQYRSVIFTHGAAQHGAAERSKAALEASGPHAAPIVTEIVASETFYPADDYHQEFYDNNKNFPYCRFVIMPKLRKLGLPE